MNVQEVFEQYRMDNDGITDMAKMMKVTQQTVRNRFEELQDQYWMENRMIGKLAQSA